MAVAIRNRSDSPLAKAIEGADVDELFNWCKGLLDDGRAQRRPHEAKWWENIATFNGDLWVEYDWVNRRLFELHKEDHRVRIPVNLAQPAVRTEYAKLLKNRPIVNPIARSSDKSDLDSAKVADQMLNGYAEKQFNLPKIRRQALQWTLVCGKGGVFVDYDPTLKAKIEVPVDPDGRPVFTNEEIEQLQQLYRDRHQAMKMIFVQQGELVVSAKSPFQWVHDFSKNTVEESMWCIVDDLVDVDEVWRRYGVEIVNPPSMKISVLEARLFDNTGIPMNYQPHRSNNQKLVELHRLFVKPGHRYFPNGCEIAFTDTEIVDAKDFPFQDGELPLSAMGHIFNPTSQHPTSILQQIKPIVLEISKTESQMIENRNLMANPPWVEYRQNRIEGEIENRPGLRLEIDYVPNVPEPHPIQMPDMPGYVRDMPVMLKEHVLEISGQNETSQGQVPPGARSGVAIAYLTEENDTKLGPTSMEWEEMNERFSWQILSRFAQFYDLPRTIQIYKPHSDPEVLNFYGRMLQGVAGVQVEQGSSLPRSLAAKQQFTLDLYDRGLIRNPRTIKDMLQVGSGEAEEWEKDMDQQDFENSLLAGGEFVEVEEWHNHMAHLYVLHDFMKSRDWYQLSQDEKAPYIDHEQKHQNAMRLQQQQQMAAQQGPARGNNPTQAANGQNQAPPSGPYASPDDMGAVSEAGAVQSSIQ